MKIKETQKLVTLAQAEKWFRSVVPYPLCEAQKEAHQMVPEVTKEIRKRREKTKRCKTQEF